CAKSAAQIRRRCRAPRAAGADALKADRPHSGGVRTPLPHDSASLHVAGEARYVDDIPEPRGTLYAALGTSAHAHARVMSLDLSAVKRAPGVAAVVCA